MTCEACCPHRQEPAGCEWPRPRRKKMHPGLLYWWKQRHERHEHGDEFGVRRPLRFLAYKLELDEKQVGELAKILSDLKTERAQADVDGRRTISGFADAIGGATFDEAGAKTAADLRVKSAERLRD